MRMTKELERLMQERGIRQENILYLPIANVFLDRIVAGAKKYEFREYSDFYFSRLVDDHVAEDEQVKIKPIHYIMFQAGYSKNARRALVELNDWGFRLLDENDEPQPWKFEEERKAAYAEGFTDEDEFFIFILGDVIYQD